MDDHSIILPFNDFTLDFDEDGTGYGEGHCTWDQLEALGWNLPDSTTFSLDSFAAALKPNYPNSPITPPSLYFDTFPHTGAENLPPIDIDVATSPHKQILHIQPISQPISKTPAHISNIALAPEDKMIKSAVSLQHYPSLSSSIPESISLPIQSSPQLPLRIQHLSQNCRRKAIGSKKSGGKERQSRNSFHNAVEKRYRNSL